METVKKLGFKYFLRQLNQDALENLFSTIRQTNGCNSNPTVQQFQAGITTVILNKCSSGKTLGKNCADDDNTLLFDLRELLDTGEKKSPDPPECIFHTVTEPQCSLQRGANTDIPDFKSSLGQCPSKRQRPTYICGYLAKRVLGKNKECRDCRICSASLVTEDALITFLPYLKNILRSRELKNISHKM